MFPAIRPWPMTPCEDLTKIVLKQMFCFCYKGPFEVLFLLPPQNSTSKQYQNNLAVAVAVAVMMARAVTRARVVARAVVRAVAVARAVVSWSWS